MLLITQTVAMKRTLFESKPALRFMRAPCSIYALLMLRNRLGVTGTKLSLPPVYSALLLFSSTVLKITNKGLEKDYHSKIHPINMESSSRRDRRREDPLLGVVCATLLSVPLFLMLAINSLQIPQIPRERPRSPPRGRRHRRSRHNSTSDRHRSHSWDTDSDTPVGSSRESSRLRSRLPAVPGRTLISYRRFREIYGLNDDLSTSNSRRNDRHSRDDAHNAINGEDGSRQMADRYGDQGHNPLGDSHEAFDRDLEDWVREDREKVRNGYERDVEHDDGSYMPSAHSNTNNDFVRIRLYALYNNPEDFDGRSRTGETGYHGGGRAERGGAESTRNRPQPRDRERVPSSSHPSPTPGRGSVRAHGGRLAAWSSWWGGSG